MHSMSELSLPYARQIQAFFYYTYTYIRNHVKTDQSQTNVNSQNPDAEGF